jgi:hypothetical protein
MYPIVFLAIWIAMAPDGLADDATPQAPPLALAMRKVKIAPPSELGVWLYWDLVNPSGHRVEVAFYNDPESSMAAWWAASKVYGTTYHSPESAPRRELIVKTRIRKGSIWTDIRRTTFWTDLGGKNLPLDDPAVGWVNIAPTGHEPVISLRVRYENAIDELEVTLPFRENGQIKTAILKWTAKDEPRK